MNPPRVASFRSLIQHALQEDIGTGDLTTRALVPDRVRGRASVVFQQSGVVCGMPLLAAVYQQLHKSVSIRFLKEDGTRVSEGTTVAKLEGPMHVLLTGERTVLNFLQRLSGIATLTRQFVERVRGTRAAIVDTRKTTPGLRVLEKYAVCMGGGRNHRFGLYDAVLIKDNHLNYRRDAGYLAQKIQEMRKRLPRGTRLEIEAQTEREALAYAKLGIDVLMLDNIPVQRLAPLVGRIRNIRRDILIEASGGVTLSRVSRIARSGVDWISAGALTHSAPACDISMDIHPVREP